MDWTLNQHTYWAEVNSERSQWLTVVCVVVGLLCFYLLHLLILVVVVSQDASVTNTMSLLLLIKLVEMRANGCDGFFGYSSQMIALTIAEWKDCNCGSRWLYSPLLTLFPNSHNFHKYSLNQRNSYKTYDKQNDNAMKI